MTLHIPMAFKVETYDSLADLGFCSGPHSGGRVCVQVAISRAINCGVRTGPEDSPNCVSVLDNGCGIGVNDCEWTSPQARAAALRDLGLVQLGTAGTRRGAWQQYREAEERKRFLPVFCRLLAWQLRRMFKELEGVSLQLVVAADRFEKGDFTSGQEAYRDASEDYSAFVTLLTDWPEWLPMVDLSNPQPWELHKGLTDIMKLGELVPCEVTDAILLIAVKIMMEAYALEGRTPEAIRALCRRET